MPQQAGNEIAPGHLVPEVRGEGSGYLPVKDRS